MLLLLPHWALASSKPDPYATGIGPGLGDVALLGLLVLSVWALAPKLRAARWPGPVRRLARTSYERWLTAHRLTGLFVIAAVAHGAIVDPTIRRSTLLQVVFFVVGGIGIAAYLYRELLARYVIPVHDYTVADVRRPSANTIEASLEPGARAARLRAGAVRVPRAGRRPRLGAPPVLDREQPLRATARGGCQGVRGLHARAARQPEAGHAREGRGAVRRLRLPERRTGAGLDRGRHRDHAVHELDPLLDGGFDRDVDFFYSVATRADALFADEIAAAGERHPSLRLHLVVTDEQGFLTPEQAVPADRAGVVWIYLVRPAGDDRRPHEGLQALGVPAVRIRWEDFGAR